VRGEEAGIEMRGVIPGRKDREGKTSILLCFTYLLQVWDVKKGM
jgi:hypothetical protein